MDFYPPLNPPFDLRCRRDFGRGKLLTCKGGTRWVGIQTIGRAKDAPLLSFTLDTNCLIDLDEARPAATFVRELILAAEIGRASVALVASSASERQSSGNFLSSFAEFDKRRKALGLGKVELLPSLGRWGVSFYGNSLWASEENLQRERRIYEVLFPNTPFEWIDFAAAKGAAEKDNGSQAYRRWRNQILDAQAYWAHDHAGRSCFVTSDTNFSRLEASVDFPSAKIRKPEDAVFLL